MSDAFNHFDQIAASLATALEQIVHKTAVDCQGNIQAKIRANGQVDTGFMLNSVHVEPVDRFTDNVIVGASYGPYQNYGTRYMPGRPFFEPGIEVTRPGFEAALGAIEGELT